MSDRHESEWQGRHAAKDELRNEIWGRLDAEGLSPREPYGHIPTFVGADAAATLLAELPIWQNAQVIKSNPDTAHIPVRLRALQDGKRIYMAVPRLVRDKPFVELTAQDIVERGYSVEAGADWRTALDIGRPVALEEMLPIDLVLVGCVAVTCAGGRTGKGAGFADLELGMLRELGLLAADTPIVAVVHDVQVVEDRRLPMESHDSPLGWIVTPTRVIRTSPAYQTPSGIDWERVRPEQFESIPVLRALYDQQHSDQ